jgi:protein TonB
VRLTVDYDTAPRGTGVAVVVLLHLVVFAALLRIEAVRNAVADAAPLFASFITPEQPKVELPPPPMLPKIVPKKEPPRLITTEVPAKSAAEFIAPPPPMEPVVVVPEVIAAPSPPLPPVASTPKLITHVEYIRAPQVEYPAVSRRLGEQGRVLLRVLINRQGHAERVEVQKSSGSQRLDDAAIKAAREALYRPYSENGEAIPVWALVPTRFELS